MFDVRSPIRTKTRQGKLRRQHGKTSCLSWGSRPQAKNQNNQNKQSKQFPQLSWGSVAPFQSNFPNLVGDLWAQFNHQIPQLSWGSVALFNFSNFKTPSSSSSNHQSESPGQNRRLLIDDFSESTVYVTFQKHDVW